MKCTYYWVNNKWKPADKALKEEIQKIGYVAIEGDTIIGPPDTPPTKEEIEELILFQKERVELPFTEKRILCTRCKGNNGYVEITWKSFESLGTLEIGLKEILCVKCWAMLHESFSQTPEIVENRQILNNLLRQAAETEEKCRDQS